MPWHYAVADQPRGPVSDDEFERLVAAGAIQPETLVWREGMPAWEPWSRVQQTTLGQPSSAAPPPIQLMAPQLAPAAKSGETLEPGTVVCAECGRRLPEVETVRFSERNVCSVCKPVLVQRLREGAPLPTAGTGRVNEATLLEQDYQLDIPAFVRVGTETFQRHSLLLVASNLLVYAIVLAISALSMVPLVGSVVGTLVQMVVFGPLFGGVYRMTLCMIRGEPADLGMAFSGFGPRYGQYVVASAIPQAVTFVAMLPLMIPGMVMGAGPGGFGPGRVPNPAWVATWAPAAIAWVLLGWVVVAYTTCNWMYAVPLVADKNYRGWDALRLSWRMVHKHWWTNLLLFFCWAILTGVGAIACCVGMLVTAPIALGAVVAAYHEIFSRLEPRPVVAR